MSPSQPTQSTTGRRSPGLTVAQIRLLERAYFDGDPAALFDVEQVIKPLCMWADTQEHAKSQPENLAPAWDRQVRLRQVTDLLCEWGYGAAANRLARELEAKHWPEEPEGIGVQEADPWLK